MRIMQYIKDNISERALLEGLAEECMELGQASLKLIRATTKDNPTPITTLQAKEQLVEELGDVMMYLELLDIKTPALDADKARRWCGRIMSRNEKARKEKSAERVEQVEVIKSSFTASCEANHFMENTIKNTLCAHIIGRADEYVTFTKRETDEGVEYVAELKVVK